MKTIHGLQCFELDLDDDWALLDETEFDATSDTFAFYNARWDVRLCIYGERINAMGRDLLDLAHGMNAAVLSSIHTSVQALGGAVWVDEQRGVGETLTSCEVDAIAEAAGPPGVQQRMLVATVVNSVVAIYARLESASLTTDALRPLWCSIRANLFLAEPIGFDGR
ncbi:MAG: hypothetical protein R3C27_08170 [Hyphomonadaceae bacterium]